MVKSVLLALGILTAIAALTLLSEPKHSEQDESEPRELEDARPQSRHRPGPMRVEDRTSNRAGAQEGQTAPEGLPTFEVYLDEYVAVTEQYSYLHQTDLGRYIHLLRSDIPRDETGKASFLLYRALEECEHVPRSLREKEEKLTSVANRPADRPGVDNQMIVEMMERVESAYLRCAGVPWKEVDQLYLHLRKAASQGFPPAQVEVAVRKPPGFASFTAEDRERHGEMVMNHLRKATQSCYLPAFLYFGQLASNAERPEMRVEAAATLVAAGTILGSKYQPSIALTAVRERLSRLSETLFDWEMRSARSRGSELTDACIDSPESGSASANL